jgi:hypothetical protein
MTIGEPVAAKQLPSVAIHAADQAIELLQDFGLVLPAKAKAILSIYDGVQATTIIASCISMGLNPALLASEVNVRAVVEGVGLTRRYGYMAGRDFYGVGFKKGQAADDDGEAVVQSSPEGESVPSIAIILAAATYEQNVLQHGRLTGTTFVRQARPIRDYEEAKSQIEFELGDVRVSHDKNDRVVMARFVPSWNGVPQPDLAEWSYGIYLSKGVYGKYLDKKTKTLKESNYPKQFGLAKASDKRTGLDIATTRATRKASKAVTTTLYPIDDTPMAERLAMLFQHAQHVAASAEAIYSLGEVEDFDEALNEVAHRRTPNFRPPPDEKEKAIEVQSFAAQTNNRADDFADLVAESVVAEESTTKKVEEIPFETIGDDEKEYVPTQIVAFSASFDEQMALDEVAHGLTMHLAALQSTKGAVANSSLMTQVLAAIDKLNGWETRTVVVDGFTTSLPMLTIVMLSQAAVDDQGKAEIKHEVALYLAHVLIEKNSSGKTNPRYEELSDQRMAVKFASGLVYQEFIR